MNEQPVDLPPDDQVEAHLDDQIEARGQLSAAQSAAETKAPAASDADETRLRRRLGRMEGAARPDRALFRLEVARRPIITTIRRAFVVALIEKQHPLPADYVYELVKLPPDWQPCLMGSVFLGLSLAGVIWAVGWVRASRAERHAGPVQTWELTSVEKATAWLAENPEPSDEGPAAIAAADRTTSAALCEPAAPPPRPAGPEPPETLFDPPPGLGEDGWIRAGTGNESRRVEAGG